MPTINFANATGSFTYEEAAAPPEGGGGTPPPENTGPTGGRITGFQNKPNADIVIDNIPYEADIADRPYALGKVDDYTLRYEVHSGDFCSFIGDSSSINRSQINAAEVQGAVLNDNTVVKIAYRLLIEPGGANTADWFVLAEQHNADEELPNNQHTSPPVVIELVGDKFSAVARWCRPGGNPGNNVANNDLQQKRVWTASSNLARDKWYVFELEFKLNQTSGYFKVSLDGQQVVNYTGPLGYGCRSHWTMGLYRSNNSTPFACRVKNMTGSWAR